MKKLLEMLKKLLGSKSSNGSSSGFTLIELLIVIAILGILAAGLLFAINPAEKIRQSRDVKAIESIRTYSTNYNLYLVDNPTVNIAGGTAFPAGVGSPVSGGGITYNYYGTANTSYVVAATGLAAQNSIASANCGATTNTCTKYVYTSANGKSCYVATATTVNAAFTCP